MYYIKRKILKELNNKNYDAESNYKKLLSDNKKIDLFFKILIITLIVGIITILTTIGDSLLKFAPLEFWFVSVIFTLLVLLFLINRN